MFDSTFGITQVGNISEGAHVCAITHNLDPANDGPAPVNRITGIMPFRIGRAHVGGYTPGVRVWRDQELRVVAIAGAREPADQQGVILGWSDPRTIPGLEGRFNASCALWAQSVVDFIGPELAAANLPTWFYAYSWGGGASCVIAKLMRIANPHQLALAVTFGSPRFCDHGATAQFSNVIAARIFVRNDPIAILPPTFEQAPFAHVAIGAQRSRMWETWKFTANGVALEGDGTMHPSIEPNLVSYPIDVEIAQFIRQSSGEGRPHSIINYDAILRTAYPETGDRATDPGVIVEEVAGHLAAAEPRGHSSTMKEIRDQIRRQILTRELSLPSNERSADRRASRRLIRILHETTGWSVFIGQDRVYSATSKRDARGVANALRALAIQHRQQPNLWTNEDLIGVLKTYESQ
jgi:hypothetical protein